jgi:hypothetical protein
MEKSSQPNGFFRCLCLSHELGFTGGQGNNTLALRLPANGSAPNIEEVSGRRPSYIATAGPVCINKAIQHLELALVCKSKGLYALEIPENSTSKLHILWSRIRQVPTRHRDGVCNIASGSQHDIHQRSYNTLVFDSLIRRADIV